MSRIVLGVFAFLALGCRTVCEDDGETYTVGETWTCSDGCNTCECMEEDGQAVIYSTDLGCEGGGGEEDPEDYYADPDFGIPADAWQDVPGWHEFPFDDIEPADPFTYAVAMRGAEVLASYGELCADATDPVACEAEFEAMEPDEGFPGHCLPGECFRHLAVNAADDNFTVGTLDELRSFLGPIDNLEEGAMVAIAGLLVCSTHGGGRVVEGGYEYLCVEMVEICDPIVTEWVHLRVSNVGVATELGREVRSREYGVCI